jgi:hypothetical protein
LFVSFVDLQGYLVPMEQIAFPNKQTASSIALTSSRLSNQLEALFEQNSNNSESNEPTNDSSNTVKSAHSPSLSASLSSSLSTGSATSSAKPFSALELDALFANLREVHAFNATLLGQLQQCGLHAQHVAECFVRNSPGFHVYAEYCTRYPASVDTLTSLNRRPAAQSVLQAAQQRLSHPLPLGAYLLKPVQRILKYHLLLSALLDRLLSSEPPRPAEQPLRHALDLMSEIAAHINQVKRKHEHAVRCEQLQQLLLGWQVSCRLRDAFVSTTQLITTILISSSLCSPRIRAAN